jgi:hypothetical protein
MKDLEPKVNESKTMDPELESLQKQFLGPRTGTGLRVKNRNEY